MLNKIKLGPKLIGGFLLVALIGAAIGAIGIVNIKTIEAADTKLYENMTVPVSYLLKITESFQKIRVNIHKILLANTNEEREANIKLIDDFSTITLKNAQEYEKTIINEKGKNIFNDFMEKRKTYRTHLDEMIKLIKENKIDEATKIINGIALQSAKEEQEAIDRLVEYKIGRAKETSDTNSKIANLSTVTMILLTSLGFIIASIIGIFLTISITTPIKLITEGANKFAIGDNLLNGIDFTKIEKINAREDELGSIGKSFLKLMEYFTVKVNVAEEIAKGNLTIDIKTASEVDNLGKSFEGMLKSLNNILGQVSVSIDQVSSGSVQVSSASQSLSQGATEQASSLEEITSSITQISSQAKQNADNSLQANQMARKAMEGAEDGNKKMKELVIAMTDINKSADGIKRIAKAIDDIAFQINLLALNANVEAARAGKYGKGFAVVAEEVRNLAVRSANSVKEASQLVEDAIKNIDNGNKLVEITAKQIEDILNISSKVADIANEVTIASKEQTQGLEQINTALGQIDQVTQANTANAEETASASEELSGQAEQLKGMIAKFKLKEQKLLEQNSIPQELVNKIKEQLRAEKLHSQENKEKIIKPKQITQKIKQNVIKTEENKSPKDIIKLDDNDFGNF